MVRSAPRASAPGALLRQRQGKFSLAFLGAICLLMAGGAAIITDRALQPPRYLPVVPVQQGQSAADSIAVSTTKQDDPVDFSETHDSSRLTGQKAPDFTLPSIDNGEPVSLRSF